MGYFTGYKDHPYTAINFSKHMGHDLQITVGKIIFKFVLLKILSTDEIRKNAVMNSQILSTSLNNSQAVANLI